VNKPPEGSHVWTPSPLKIKDDPYARIIEIEGVRYTHEVFMGLGINNFLSMQVGDVFQVVSRDDGTIGLKRLDDADARRIWFS